LTIKNNHNTLFRESIKYELIKMKRQPPLKPKNKDRRVREYLTEAEVDSIMKAARKIGRHGNRDAEVNHGINCESIRYALYEWSHPDFFYNYAVAGMAAAIGVVTLYGIYQYIHQPVDAHVHVD
jgi:hypothetical protein